MTVNTEVGLDYLAAMGPSDRRARLLQLSHEEFLPSLAYLCSLTYLGRNDVDLSPH